MTKPLPPIERRASGGLEREHVGLVPHAPERHVGAGATIELVVRVVASRDAALRRGHVQMDAPPALNEDGHAARIAGLEAVLPGARVAHRRAEPAEPRRIRHETACNS